MMMMIKSTSFSDDYGPPPDDDLDMPGIQDSGEIHQPSSPPTHFLILTFQSKKLLILDKMTILHQDLIQHLSQSELKGNTDRSQLILLMLYQRQRPRLSSRGQSFNYQVMSNLFQFILRNMMMTEKKDLHMTLMPQVQMITQFHCRLLHQHRLCQVIMRSQRNSSGHKEHQNWVSSQNDDDETEPYETDDTPVLTEEEIAQLQEEDVDTEPCTSDHSHFVDIDGAVLVPLGPKVQAAPDFGSYDVTGFNQFEQYLAKNGKKQPKAESVITQAVLTKYAKEIKQAKLEEFRGLLDFTAMTFRDKIRHKIDNYVTGRWVLTIKVDKDRQFKKFKARWVCRGFQDAQKYDLQTDSPTATRYGFRVASQHAASMYWDLLHLDLKTAFLQGETYDLDRRVLHVQLPTDIDLPP